MTVSETRMGWARYTDFMTLPDLTLIGVRSAFNAEINPWDGTPLPEGSAMVLAGPRASHHKFAAAHGLTPDTGAH